MTAAMVCRFVLLLSAACAAASACGGGGGIPDEELEGLVISPPDEPPPIDLDRAVADGRELGRALAVGHHAVRGKLGAHVAVITSRVEVTEGSAGEPVEQLSDETRLEVAADGRYHARLDNSADYGREVIFDGQALYLRPRYAKWHRRPPNDEHEAGAILDQMYAVAGDYFDLVAHAAEVSDKGAEQVAGRAGRRVEIRLAPRPGTPPAQPLTQRTWRESVVVQALSGDAVLDAETALPLRARFSATVGFQRDGRSFTMSLEVGHELSAIGAGPAADALAVPAPEVVIATPERLREVDDRDQLLEGIAPPTRRGRAPAAAAPPAPAPAGPPPRKEVE